MRPIKTLLAIAMFGFGTTISVSAQNNKSHIAFDTYEWDFGTISTQKGAVCHTFTFKNQSKKDIKIGKQICHTLPKIFVANKRNYRNKST